MSLELPTVTLAETEPSGSYLVLDEPRGARCTLGDLQESGATHVFWVTYGDAIAAARRRPTDTEFERVTMLAVGDLATGREDTDEAGVRSVADPLDLQAVGLAINDFCTDYADERVAVVVDTLSTLVAYVGPKTAFQFAHLVRERVATVDGHSFFLFDPDAHPDHVVATLSTPFEAIVHPSNGDATVDLPEASDEDVAALVDDWTDEVAADDGANLEDGASIPTAEEIRAPPDGAEAGTAADEASDTDVAETLRDI